MLTSACSPGLTESPASGFSKNRRWMKPQSSFAASRMPKRLRPGGILTTRADDCSSNRGAEFGARTCNDRFRKALHLFQLRAELQEKQINSRSFKLGDAFHHLFKRPDQAGTQAARSEERRVGKECRARRWAE